MEIRDLGFLMHLPAYAVSDKVPDTCKAVRRNTVFYRSRDIKEVISFFGKFYGFEEALSCDFYKFLGSR